MASHPYIRVVNVGVPSFLKLIPDLGSGEASVIALALQESDCSVILDDKLARQVATSQSVKLTGTLGVLLLAKEKRLIDKIEPIIGRLRMCGFFCDTSVEVRVLRLAGEA